MGSGWIKIILFITCYNTSFSSPELKAQVSFSDCLISSKHGTEYLLVMGVQFCSNEGLRPFPRGDNYEIAKIHRGN